MKVKHLTLFLLLCLSGSSIVAQTKTPLNKALNKSSYAEKIYLQLNNTVFTTGETIWFKAIVTNTLNNPSKLSGILYVELIDFDEHILSSKILKLENGIADSFFDLDDKLPVGRYLVRAYTKWNKNFSEDFIFKQYIDIFSVKPSANPDVISDILITTLEDKQSKITAQIHPESIKANYKKDVKLYIIAEGVKDSIEIKRKDNQYTMAYVLPKDLVKVQLKVKLEDTKLKNFERKVENTYSKTVVLNKDVLDLQFFPEGGKMIAGFTNKIAYKTLNYEGLGENISGYIVDDTDSIITPFTTNKLGMGFVYFTPNKNKTYFGKVIVGKDITLKYPLPHVVAKGHMLSLGETSTHLSLQIHGNLNAKDSLYFEINSKGISIKKQRFNLENGSYRTMINKSQLPNGIISVTLLNNEQLPISKRLFFNLNDTHLLGLDIKTDKTTYTQREHAKINVVPKKAITDTATINLSVLVIDKAKLNPKRYEQPNILTYFLLHSELKGYIEKPNTYFDTTNIYRKRDLDALMLTQGWSNYVFHKTESIDNFEILPETDLNVSGRVSSVWNTKKPPKKRVTLTMLTSGEPPGAYLQTTDSIGNFVFNLRNHYTDELDILIKSTSKKGRAREFNIKIDDPIPAPKISYQREEVVALPDTIITEFLKKKTEERRAAGGFNLTDSTVELDAVELTGYNVTQEREKLFKLHGAPDVVIENEVLVEKEEQWMSGLYDLLRTKFPHDVYFRNFSFPAQAFSLGPDPIIQPTDTISKNIEIAQLGQTDHTFVFIDGEIIEGNDYSLLPFLPIENIKSVEILRRPNGVLYDYYEEAFPRHDTWIIRSMLGVKIPIVGIISIYTYGSNGIAALSTPKGLFKGKIAGLSPKREFYAPKYEVLKPEDWEIPDLRAVTHWAPSINVDKKGEAQIEFYNDDSIGDKLIIVEAITPDGKIGYFETSYTVEKRLENN